MTKIDMRQQERRRQDAFLAEQQRLFEQAQLQQEMDDVEDEDRSMKEDFSPALLLFSAGAIAAMGVYYLFSGEVVQGALIGLWAAVTAALGAWMGADNE